MKLLVHMTDLEAMKETVKTSAHYFVCMLLSDGTYVALIEPSENGGYDRLVKTKGATVLPSRLDPDTISLAHHAAISKSIPSVKPTHNAFQVHKEVFAAVGNHPLFNPNL